MIELDLHIRVDAAGVPDEARIQRWLDTALDDAFPCTVNLTIVGEPEGRALNRRWRGRDQATNVLSFPANMPPFDGRQVLGDIVLCAPVIEGEAREQGKALEDHWAHMVIHGLLHLLGFDHIDDTQAEQMEGREIALLSALGIPDPYVTDHRVG